MTPTYKIPEIQLTFQLVLQLTDVDGTFDEEPIVRYANYDPELATARNGVAIVVREGKTVLYCSAFTNRAFAQVWLYASKGYLYKQRRNLKVAFEKGGIIELYLASCDNPGSMASEINDKLNPSWD